MKKLLFLWMAMLAFTALFAQNEPNHTANYNLAARFSPDKLKKMVFSTRVDPHWLKDSDKFWYTYETSEGKSYYIVDPVAGRKSNLFDNVNMAADMSRLTGDPFDAKHLSITNLKFIKNESTLRFEVKSKLVEEEEKEEEEDEMEEEDEKEKKKSKKKMVDKIWYFEYNLGSKNLRLLEDYEKPKKHAEWATISPDSSFVLFARDHNLYWMDWENYLKAQKDKKEKDTTIVEHQWTTDGGRKLWIPTIQKRNY